jgi:hypothetical protein
MGKGEICVSERHGVWREASSPAQISMPFHSFVKINFIIKKINKSLVANK